MLMLLFGLRVWVSLSADFCRLQGAVYLAASRLAADCKFAAVLLCRLSKAVGRNPCASCLRRWDISSLCLVPWVNFASQDRCSKRAFCLAYGKDGCSIEFIQEDVLIQRLHA